MKLDKKQFLSGMGRTTVSALTAGGMLPGPLALMMHLGRSIKGNNAAGIMSSKSNAPQPGSMQAILNSYYGSPTSHKDKLKEINAIGKASINGLRFNKSSLLYREPISMFGSKTNIPLAVSIATFQILQIQTRYQMAIADKLGVGRRNNEDETKKSSSLIMGLLKFINPFTISKRIDKGLQSLSDKFETLIFGKDYKRYKKNPLELLADVGLKLSDSNKLVNINQVIANTNLKQYQELINIKTALQAIEKNLTGTNQKAQEHGLTFDIYHSDLMTKEKAAEEEGKRKKLIYDFLINKMSKGSLVTKAIGAVKGLKTWKQEFEMNKDPKADNELHRATVLKIASSAFFNVYNGSDKRINNALNKARTDPEKLSDDEYKVLFDAVERMRQGDLELIRDDISGVGINKKIGSNHKLIASDKNSQKNLNTIKSALKREYIDIEKNLFHSKILEETGNIFKGITNVSSNLAGTMDIANNGNKILKELSKYNFDLGSFAAHSGAKLGELYTERENKSLASYLKMPGTQFLRNIVTPFMVNKRIANNGNDVLDAGNKSEKTNKDIAKYTAAEIIEATKIEEKPIINGRKLLGISSSVYEGVYYGLEDFFKPFINMRVKQRSVNVPSLEHSVYADIVDLNANAIGGDVANAIGIGSSSLAALPVGYNIKKRKSKSNTTNKFIADKFGNVIPDRPISFGSIVVVDETGNAYGLPESVLNTHKNASKKASEEDDNSTTVKERESRIKEKDKDKKESVWKEKILFYLENAAEFAKEEALTLKEQAKESAKNGLDKAKKTGKTIFDMLLGVGKIAGIASIIAGVISTYFMDPNNRRAAIEKIGFGIINFISSTSEIIFKVIKEGFSKYPKETGIALGTIFAPWIVKIIGPVAGAIVRKAWPLAVPITLGYFGMHMFSQSLDDLKEGEFGSAALDALIGGSLLKFGVFNKISKKFPSLFTAIKGSKLGKIIKIGTVGTALMSIEGIFGSGTQQDRAGEVAHEMAEQSILFDTLPNAFKSGYAALVEKFPTLGKIGGAFKYIKVPFIGAAASTITNLIPFGKKVEETAEVAKDGKGFFTIIKEAIKDSPFYKKVTGLLKKFPVLGKIGGTGLFGRLLRFVAAPIVAPVLELLSSFMRAFIPKADSSGTTFSFSKFIKDFIFGEVKGPGHTSSNMWKWAGIGASLGAVSPLPGGAFIGGVLGAAAGYLFNKLGEFLDSGDDKKVTQKFGENPNEKNTERIEEVHEDNTKYKQFEESHKEDIKNKKYVKIKTTIVNKKNDWLGFGKGYEQTTDEYEVLVPAKIADVARERLSDGVDPEAKQDYLFSLRDYYNYPVKRLSSELKIVKDPNKKDEIRTSITTYKAKGEDGIGAGESVAQLIANKSKGWIGNVASKVFNTNTPLSEAVDELGITYGSTHGSRNKCGLAVGNVLLNHGYSITIPDKAYSFGDTLKNAGFEDTGIDPRSPDYVPQHGDIVVVDKSDKDPTGRAINGHIAMYDGKNKRWISDYNQGPFAVPYNGGKGYPDQKATIFRDKKLNNTTTAVSTGAHINPTVSFGGNTPSSSSGGGLFDIGSVVRNVFNAGLSMFGFGGNSGGGVFGSGSSSGGWQPGPGQPLPVNGDGKLWTGKFNANNFPSITDINTSYMSPDFSQDDIAGEVKGLPDNVRKKIKKYAPLYGINPVLAEGQAMQESEGKMLAPNSAGAMGIMQVIPKYLPEYKDYTGKSFTVSDANDIDGNINAGLAELKSSILRYKGNPRLGLVAYNGGIGNVDSLIKKGRWLKSGGRIPQESAQYVGKVLGRITPGNGQGAGEDTFSLIGNLINGNEDAASQSLAKQLENIQSGKFLFDSNTGAIGGANNVFDQGTTSSYRSSGNPVTFPSNDNLPSPNTPGTSTAQEAADAVTKAVDGRTKSLHQCAKWVRTGLQKVGYNFTQQPNAYQYVTNHVMDGQLGFTQINPNTPPQKGDISVIGPMRPGHAGHMTIYNGQAWVSDFLQGHMVPYNHGKGYPNQWVTLWRDMGKKSMQHRLNNLENDISGTEGNNYTYYNHEGAGDGEHDFAVHEDAINRSSANLKKNAPFLYKLTHPYETLKSYLSNSPKIQLKKESMSPKQWEDLQRLQNDETYGVPLTDKELTHKFIHDRISGAVKDVNRPYAMMNADGPDFDRTKKLFDDIKKKNEELEKERNKKKAEEKKEKNKKSDKLEKALNANTQASALSAAQKPVAVPITPSSEAMENNAIGDISGYGDSALNSLIEKTFLAVSSIAINMAIGHTGITTAAST